MKQFIITLTLSLGVFFVLHKISAMGKAQTQANLLRRRKARSGDKERQQIKVKAATSTRLTNSTR